MSLFEDGVKVLRIAADQGNRPAQAVLDELTFRQDRINVLHEINSDLNAKLREARLQLAQQPQPRYKIVGTNGDAHLEVDDTYTSQPVGFSEFHTSRLQPTYEMLNGHEDDDPDPMEHLTHAA